MLNILIVDDIEYKLDKIKSILKDELIEDTTNVDCATNVQEAKRFLKLNQYDLLILDLFLPIVKGENPTAKNGTGLLDAVSCNENLKKPFYIFGLTARSDEASEAREIFSKNMWFLIDYDATSGLRINYLTV